MLTGWRFLSETVAGWRLRGRTGRHKEEAVASVIERSRPAEIDRGNHRVRGC